MVGSFKTAERRSKRILQAWLMQYVNGNLSAGPATVGRASRWSPAGSR